MTTMNMTVRMDREVKEKADALFNELGMTTSGAVQIFIRQAIREGRLPFTPSLVEPNETTLAAMREAEVIAADPSSKRYTNMDELYRDLMD